MVATGTAVGVHACGEWGADSAEATEAERRVGSVALAEAEAEGAEGRRLTGAVELE